MRKIILFLALVVVLTTQSLFAQVPSYVPTNGLVGYWPFNGNANDESGNGNNGIVTGATLTSDRFGNANSAYSFDGLDDFIWTGFVQQLSGSQFATISYWINSPLNFPNNAAGNYGTAIGHWKHNGQFGGPIGLQITNISDGSINVSLIGGQGTSSNPSVINPNSWTHVVLVYDGTQVTNERIAIYLNGIFSQFINMLNIPSAIGVEATRTYIGAACGPDGVDDAWSYFTGKIDDVGFWTIPLTQKEITNLYNSTSFNECLTMTINTGVLSTNPFTYTSSVSIYPNPANDQITIDCGTLANVSGWSIKITNMQGQEVFSQPMNTQQYVAPLNTWSGQGMYFVKIINAQNEVVNIKKIILQ